MKSIAASVVAIFALLTSTMAADDGHGHGKVIPGPNGGRILEIEGGHAEFFVESDKKVKVTFYGEDMKPVAPSTQVVTAVAEAPNNKVTLDFEKTPEAFVSNAALPEGDGYRVVLQIRPDENAKAKNFRIDYHTEVCGTCKRAEYACICSSGAADGHGH